MKSSFLTVVFDNVGNALVTFLLAVLCCLSSIHADIKVGELSTVNFCSEQISSNYSCFNQYLQSQFDYEGLPGSSDELNSFCDAFDKGMKCLDMFVVACLGQSDRVFYERRMSPARQTMNQLCSESELRNEYLRHASCYDDLSVDWNNCAIPIKMLVDDENKQSELPATADNNRAKINKICLAKEQFLNCTISATETKCNQSAVNVLQHLAETLSGAHSNEECVSSVPHGQAAVVRDDGTEDQKKLDVYTASGPSASHALLESSNFQIITFVSTTVTALRLSGF